MIVDTILRVFCIVVGILIFVIVMVVGLITCAKLFGDNLRTLALIIFLGDFPMILIWGATQGFFFISPSDGWVEIIIEALAISLIPTAVLVIGVGAYARRRKDKQ